MVLYGLLVFITACVCVWLLFNVCDLCGLLCDVVGVCCSDVVLRLLLLFCFLRVRVCVLSLGVFVCFVCESSCGTV